MTKYLCTECLKELTKVSGREHIDLRFALPTPEMYCTNEECGQYGVNTLVYLHEN